MRAARARRRSRIRSRRYSAQSSKARASSTSRRLSWSRKSHISSNPCRRRATKSVILQMNGVHRKLSLPLKSRPRPASLNWTLSCLQSNLRKRKKKRVTWSSNCTSRLRNLRQTSCASPSKRRHSRPSLPSARLSSKSSTQRRASRSKTMRSC